MNVVGQMRAPQNEASGTAGQSFVKGQFEALGWGAVPNPEHDLGTDIWLMARDARRFDLKALVGAQVKTGSSYFKSAKKVDGRVVGWWFKEEDDSHFEYWCGHSIPHIVVLHSLSDNESYWVQVRRERVVDTGKGRKIFVPADSVVDAGHFDELIALATSTSKVPQWEGSAWRLGEPIPQSSLLRYALLTPRLVAPHPNDQIESLGPEEAIALLVQCRLRDLQGWDPKSPRIRLDEVRKSTDWRWRFFVSLYDWLTEGDLTGFNESLIGAAPDESSRVAATVCHAVALVERGDVVRARALLEERLDADAANPADHGWMQAQLARCYVELGELSRARDLALETQVLRQVTPADPTSLAVVAGTGHMVFTLGDWDGRSIAEMVQGNDTAATWWRSQTLASGLSNHFDDTYRSWARDTAKTFGAEDDARNKLRSAMLLAGFGADSSAWRHAASLLARRGLMSPVGEESPEWAIDLLRLAGSENELTLATRHLLAAGPISALVNVGNGLNLDRSTRTSIKSDMTFIQCAADVLATTDCDRFAQWAIFVLERPVDLRGRLKPLFLVEHAVLSMLRELVHCVSKDIREGIMDHIVALPILSDGNQLVARGYGEMVARLEDYDWWPRHWEALSQRPVGDNFEIRDPIDRLLATNDADFRSTLLKRIGAGDLRALGSYGNVTDLPGEVAASAIEALSEGVLAQVEEAKKGTFGLGGQDLLAGLILLNAWHPGVADWTACEASLSCPVSHPAHVEGGIRMLGRLRDHVPGEARELLRKPLQDIAARIPADSFTVFAEGDARGAASLTVALLYPETVSAGSLRRLLRGAPGQRAAAVNILIAREDPSQLNMLSVLARDADLDVRTEAAEGIANWCVRGVAMPDCAGVLRELLEEPGVALAVRVSRALLSSGAQPEAIEMLGGMLHSHPSAAVRNRVKLAQEPNVSS